MIAHTNKKPDTKARKLVLALNRAANQAAFSLVEVTLAIGIVAIAIIPVFGLIPTGLNAFHQAIDASVGSQIAQRIINDAQQTDFKTLIKNASGETQTTPFPQSTRHFDDQGNEVKDTDPAAASAIYQALTVITPISSMPQADGNPNIATVSVQIANNPSKKPLPTDATTKRWKTSATIPIVAYSAIVANNQ